MSEQSSIRIIGGKWRSRKVIFETKKDLRPTPDRVRETLFNWLSPHIAETVCLDLYAGSGILGLEALSRGAKQVYALEVDHHNMLQIEASAKKLQTTDIIVINKNVLDWLQSKPIIADVVFIDPPYKLNLLAQTFNMLEKFGWIQSGSFIYFEQDQVLDINQLPTTWSIWRQSKAGNVHYYLARKQ